MKKIATIILNFNGLKDTLDCLKSLVKINQNNFDHQVFLVDFSKDKSEADKIAIKFPSIQIIRKKDNLGFAKGNNIGIRKALKWGANYILLLNNDTLVSLDFSSKLFNYLEKNPQVGAVSPKIYFAKGFEYHKNKYKNSNLGKVIWYAGGKIDWNNIYGSHIGVDQVDTGQFGKISETDFFSGACVLIKANILDIIGLFNPKLFLYWEDADLSIRIKKAGFKIMYFPNSHIWHKNAGSSSVGSDLHDYFLNRNRLWFGFKYATTKTKLALLRQSLTSIFTAKKWERQAILDYYFGRMEKGSWKV